MRMIFRILLPVAVLGFVACSDNEQKNTNTPAAATTAPFNTTAPATGTATPGATAALNPAHGEPNHRCDIPVGAPLNSPAQPKLNVPTTVVPPLQPNQIPAGAVAPGTNPPHGQPGHDCSKPVGAPL